MANTVEAIRFYCQKVLPAVYDDSLSYYELLCKFGDKLNELIEAYNGSPSKINELIAEIESLRDELDKWKDGGYADYIGDTVEEWVDSNLDYLFTHVVKQVWFGLTDTGYFCAYIPDSWSDVEFDTGAVYGSDTYGRLLLRYDVDGSGVIDNTAY